MTIPSRVLDEIIAGKDTDAALNRCTYFRYCEAWAVIDGAVVIYDLDHPPAWIVKRLAELSGLEQVHSSVTVPAVLHA